MKLVKAILISYNKKKKSDTHFKKWLGVYPFYTNVQNEGVKLYGIA